MKAKKRFTRDRWWDRFYKKLSLMEEPEVRQIARVIEHELATRTTLAESAAKTREVTDAKPR